MVASLWGSVGTGTKEDESSTGRIWTAGFHHVTARSGLGCWISLCYGPFWLRLLDFTVLQPILTWHAFETYEPFISLIFQIFSGHCKTQIIETVDTESTDTGVCVYMQNYCYTGNSTFQ
jgi:hypothetical protein